MSYTDECFLNPPPCDGIEQHIQGECCPVCVPLELDLTPPTTTSFSSSSTTSLLPDGACIYENNVFENGNFWGVAIELLRKIYVQVKPK